MRSEKYVGICSNVVIKTDCWSLFPCNNVGDESCSNGMSELRYFAWNCIDPFLFILYLHFILPSYDNHCWRTITPVCSLIAHAVCILYFCHILNDELPQGYYLAWVPHVCIGTVGQWKRGFLSSVYELFNLLDYKNNFVLHWWSNNQRMRICLGAAAASEAGEKLNLQGVCVCRICSNVNMSNCTNFCKKFLFRPEGLDTWLVCDHDCEYEGLSKESLIGGGKREQLKKRKNKEGNSNVVKGKNPSWSHWFCGCTTNLARRMKWVKNHKTCTPRVKHITLI